MLREVLSQPELVDPLLEGFQEPELVSEQIRDLFFGVREPVQLAGERALMRAVLRDAVVCLVGQAAPIRHRRQLAYQARHWVQSRSRQWVFSFENICDTLGINAGYARGLLLRLVSSTPSSKSGASRGEEAGTCSPAVQARLRVIRRNRPKVRSGTSELAGRRRVPVPGAPDGARCAATS